MTFSERKFSSSSQTYHLFFDPIMAEKLAIYSDLPKIVKLIENNTVCSIIAPTGSGKSIGVIWALMREGETVMCTQPTIPAATSLCDYQKKLSPQFSVGFAAEGQINYNMASNSVYCTAGHLRKVMKGCFKNGKAAPMRFTDVLFVDEIHVGSRDNSIIIDLWIEAFKQGVKVPKLVLATATEFGCHELMQRLATLTTPENPKPAVFRSTFRHYPVQIRYNQRRDYDEPDTEDSFVDAARIAVDLLAEKRGHGIVFCSGSAEVEEVAYEINELLDSKRLRTTFDRPVKVVGCFGQSKREDIDEAICDENDKPEKERVIKIVVTTNLCESSLTVPDVIFIVDALTEKRSDLVNGRFHLGTTWISKNSADQRKGRTGRTLRDGVCHRMCTEKFYDRLESFRPLEITRTPIADVVIEFMTIGLDPVKVISDLEHFKLIEAKQTLMETGCIVVPEVIKTAKELHDEMYPPLGGYIPRPALPPTITHKGFFVAEMPMDVRNAAAMFDYLNGSKDKNDFWAVVAFVMVDIYGPSLFWFPRKEKNENPKAYRYRIQEHANKHFSKFLGANPVESLCNAFYDCLDSLSRESSPTISGSKVPSKSEKSSSPGAAQTPRSVRNGLDAPFWKLRTWAVDNSCNNKKLREIVVQIKRIQKMLQRYTFPGVPDPNNKGGSPLSPPGKRVCEYIPGSPNTIVAAREGIVKAFTDTYKTKILVPMGYDYAAPDGHKVKVDTMKTVSRSAPGSKVLPLSEIHIRNKDGEQIMISLWIDAWIDRVAEAAALKKMYEAMGYSMANLGFNYGDDDSSSE